MREKDWVAKQHREQMKRKELIFISSIIERYPHQYTTSSAINIPSESLAIERIWQEPIAYKHDYEYIQLQLNLSTDGLELLKFIGKWTSVQKNQLLRAFIRLHAKEEWKQNIYSRKMNQTIKELLRFGLIQEWQVTLVDEKQANAYTLTSSGYNLLRLQPRDERFERIQALNPINWIESFDDYMHLRFWMLVDLFQLSEGNPHFVQFSNRLLVKGKKFPANNGILTLDVRGVQLSNFFVYPMTPRDTMEHKLNVVKEFQTFVNETVGMKLGNLPSDKHFLLFVFRQKEEAVEFASSCQFASPFVYVLEEANFRNFSNALYYIEERRLTSISVDKEGAA